MCISHQHVRNGISLSPFPCSSHLEIYPISFGGTPHLSLDWAENSVWIYSSRSPPLFNQFCQDWLLHVSQSLPLFPHPHAITTVVPFIFFLYLISQTSSWPFLPHLHPSPQPRSDVVTPLSEKVQMKPFKNYLTSSVDTSLPPASPSTPTHACLSLYSYLQFCTCHPSLTSLPSTLGTCCSHCWYLSLPSHHLFFYMALVPPFKTPLLWECFPNFPSSPGLTQTFSSVIPNILCVAPMKHLSYLYYNHLHAASPQPHLAHKACGNSE